MGAMTYHLFLDDERVPSDVDWVALPTPPKPWVIVRSMPDFVQTIQARGLPELISFDHDLGQTPAGKVLETGMDCAKWLVDFCLDNDLTVPPFIAHSKNGPGRDNIVGLLRALSDHQKRQSRSP